MRGGRKGTAEFSPSCVKMFCKEGKKMGTGSRGGQESTLSITTTSTEKKREGGSKEADKGGGVGERWCRPGFRGNKEKGRVFLGQKSYQEKEELQRPRAILTVKRG